MMYKPMNEYVQTNEAFSILLKWMYHVTSTLFKRPNSHIIFYTIKTVSKSTMVLIIFQAPLNCYPGR